MISESDAAYLLQQALNAAPTAALYAMLAFGYCLSFGLTRRAEFTAGALFAFAGQVFVFFTAFGYDRFRLIYPAALAVGAAAALSYTLLAAIVVSRGVIRPLSLMSPNSVIVASLAVMIVLMELVRIAANARDLWLSPFLNGRMTFWAVEGFPVVLTAIQVINTLSMTAIVLASALVLARSRWGRNWRAVADDAAAARLLGVNADRVMLAATVITALFSAVAGIMATAYYGSMDFGAGLMFGLKVVMIAAIGDQSSPTKSALGAAFFGAIETFWGAYLPFQWRDPAMFSLLVLLAVLLRRQARV